MERTAGRFVLDSAHSCKSHSLRQVGEEES